MIVYERLWETMKTKEISQYRLINYHQFSSGQLNRLRKNMNVSTHTVDTLCRILGCQVEDIMEYRQEPPADTTGKTAASAAASPTEPADGTSEKNNN